MTGIICTIWKCQHNDNGVCTKEKIRMTKLGCVDVKIR